MGMDRSWRGAEVNVVVEGVEYNCYETEAMVLGNSLAHWHRTGRSVKVYRKVASIFQVGWAAVVVSAK